MYDLIYFVNVLIMNYFDGINFVNWGDGPHYTGALKNRFSGYYGIQYNHSGTVYCQVGDNPVQYAHGACAFITFPGQLFQYGPGPDAQRHHMFICFNGIRAERFIESGLMTLRERNPIIQITNFDRFYSNLKKLHLCLDASQRQYDQAVHLLEGLLLQLVSEQQHEEKSDDPLRAGFMELVAEINRRPELEWDFKREAVDMGISYMHFRRLFRGFFGCPPGQFLQRIRLNCAAERLSSTDDPISTIAEFYGFCDSHHFSRLFRRQFMIPPATYRREYPFDGNLSEYLR